jgi:glutamyl-tRNA synthetase
LHERAKTLDELAEFAVFYLKDEIAIDAKASAKFLKPEIGEPMRTLAAEIDSVDGEFSATTVQQAFERVLAKFSLKLGQLAQPVRVAITGGTVSPGIYEVIDVLGKERTVARLANAIKLIEQRP